MKRYILFTAEELDDMIHGSDLTCDSLILETEGIAKQVLDDLNRFIQLYGVVLVSDLCDLVGLVPKYLDNNYGWVSLEKAEITKVKHGYELKLPRALPLS